MNFKGKMHEKSGITLITLAVTIIILLILAGITIATITSNNGIIKNANDAKEQTEIAEEKEIVDRASLQAMGNNKRGNLVEDELQEQLDKITDNGKTEVSDNGAEFEVVFVDSNRYYVVDRNGNIGEQGEILNDKSLGNIALGVNGETLPENEYQIWSIEDLVILSNISRGKGNYIENGEIKNTTQNNFSGCTIKLMRSLNFNSKLSYADLSIGWSYDEANEVYIIDETSTQNLRELLMDKNGVGFVPISEKTASSHFMFAGIFDGQNYEIQNLYEITDKGGLFSGIYGGSVINLGLVNIDITGTGGTVGGIVGNAGNCKFYNIYVSGILKGHGGISGGAYRDITLVNCCNLANIVGDRFEGGLIGYADNTAKINIANCYNMGKVTVNVPTTGSYHSIGGILGRAYCSTINITNCCSIGTLVKVNSSHYKNFYNICHTVGDVTLQLERCCYLDTSIDESSIAINENSISFSKNDANSVVENLNEYVEKHKDEYKVMYGIELYSWKLDDSGLPIFEK